MSAQPRNGSPVTVIVPVYRGRDEVEACLQSVLRHAASSAIAHELLVIDDASPEPEVSELLDRLATNTTALPLTLLRNEENLGFVKTVNRGFARARGDVVVLNADTEVTEGWLDRLADAASSRDDVATVTPLTNAGSICTLPPAVIDAFALDSDRPSIDACGDFISSFSGGFRPHVITGVGFCMYVTRRALDACGLFDEEAYGLGYGEEVDFCLRATSKGLCHLVEDSTFVFHHGAVSFAERHSEALALGNERVHERHPTFRADNARERAEDPLRVSFATLEQGLADRGRGLPHVLHLLHSPPEDVGGTEKHVRRLIEGVLPEFEVSILYPLDGDFVLRSFLDSGSAHPLEREYLLARGPRDEQVHNDVAAEALRLALDLFDFDVVHIQNLIGHSLAPLEVLADFAGEVICSVHDLFLACPSFSLLYRNEQACGLPEDLACCARCLPVTAELSLGYLREFRAAAAARIGVVDRWVFASQSAADYFLRVYDVDPSRVEVIPHGSTIDPTQHRRDVDEALIFDEPLRLAFVGIGWAKKGLQIVNRLADDLAHTSVEIHHFGPLKEEPSPHIHAHGSYDNALLPVLLHQAGIQIVLLPGAYAETFGLVMTEALVAGLPVMGARYGALAERIRETGAGWTIDPEDPDGIREVIEHLDRCRIELLRATRRAVAVPIETVADTLPRYTGLYRTTEREQVGAGAERGAPS